MATSVDQTAARQQYNMRYVWAISLVAALGGLMFGYDWVVISGTEPFFRRFFHVASAGAEGWAMSMPWSVACWEPSCPAASATASAANGC